jgi:hypothetical protein
VYHKPTDLVYYIPSKYLGSEGRTGFNLRLKNSKNNQLKGILWAKDFIVF